MKVSLDSSALGQTKWYEYVLRFAFGGAVTVIAGIIAKKFGPAIGGLFLAFPAIFPASATLIEKHEEQKKQRAHLDGTSRGRQAAGLDAAGAAIGSIGLVAFAVVVWRLPQDLSTWLVLLSATLAWMATSGIIWYLRKTKAGMRRVTRSHDNSHQKL